MKSIDEMTEFLFKSDPLEPSDVIIVPGSLSYHTLEHAAELYHAGWAPMVAISGKYSADMGRFPWEKIKKDRYRKPYETEWAFMKAVLVENGVPEEAILIEKQATYTMENAVKLRELFEKRGIDIKTAILSVKDYHARRTFMYFDLVFDDVRWIMSPVEIKPASKDMWWTNEIGIITVIREFKKIGEQFTPLYLEKSRISKQ